MNIITIDGVVASGKSTIARMIAQNLHYYYICSGLLYRALAYLLINHYGYTEHTVDQLNPVDIAACFDANVFKYTYDSIHQEKIFFAQQDITPYLKDSFIDKIASITSVDIYVRHCVTQVQHALAQDHNIVIDGRDVGSVVFPHAQIKFYLTAAIDVRAQRWLIDQKKHGHIYTLQEAIEKIADRDERDRKRVVAPLVIPHGAIVIDSTDLNLQQTFELMMSHIHKIM